MECKITSTKPVAHNAQGEPARERRHPCRRGFSLVELMVAVGVGSLVLLGLSSFFLHSAKSLLAMTNYAELSRGNRYAIDLMTRELRQAKRLTSYQTNSVTLEDPNGAAFTYTYSPGKRTLSRTRDGATSVLLRDCDYLLFTIGQRNPVGGAYDVYPVATPGTAKVINVSWKCNRKAYGNVLNTENVQTARIVIRNQQ
jgi:prepilin-type N-terminal cleavage/methylation domain-containing protein